jgi:hypothetical protein
MGLTADDLQQQATSREDEEEEANISSNSCTDASSNDTEYGADHSHSAADKPGQRQCQRLLLLQKREGLIDITVRTVNLVRRNQQLQHRLAALQAETRAFVRLGLLVLLQSS